MRWSLSKKSKDVKNRIEQFKSTVWYKRGSVSRIIEMHNYLKDFKEEYLQHIHATNAKKQEKTLNTEQVNSYYIVDGSTINIDNFFKKNYFDKFNNICIFIDKKSQIKQP